MNQYMVFLFDDMGEEVVAFAGTAPEDMLPEGLIAARVTYPRQFLGGKTFRSLVLKSPATGQYIVAYVELSSKPV